MPRLFLLFSHTLTHSQVEEAHLLGIEAFVALPTDLQDMFSNVPPDLESLESYAQPFCQWLVTNAHRGDYALIQGDFGLIYLLINFCKSIDVLPIYATTQRNTTEVVQADGSIKKESQFIHIRFRAY